MVDECWQCIFALKPIFTQTVGKKLDTYFTIDHKKVLSVQEDGSGDISSLWFNVQSSDDTFYSSQISFAPVRKAYGTMLYAALQLPYGFQVSLNSALVHTTNDINLQEANIENLGITPLYATIEESFRADARTYGRVDGQQSKTGLDDIQVKIIKPVHRTNQLYVDMYLLGGIPTGKGSKATYFFEPLVGSKHGQLGVGANIHAVVSESVTSCLSVQGEIKWRYALKASERRSFDLTENDSWARYMMVVEEADKYAPYPAINDLSLKVKVKPRNSLDVYAALHYEHLDWRLEAGWDFWFRNAEKIAFKKSTILKPNIGIADLLGIALLDPESASTANISQGIEPGPNQMTSDMAFVAVTLSDLNLNSGAQQRSLSNTFYLVASYQTNCGGHPLQLGAAVSYELGANKYSPHSVGAWLSCDICL